MQDTVEHAAWCDRFHEVVGSPDCSAIVYRMEAGPAVMLFRVPRGKRTHLVVVGGAQDDIVASYDPAIDELFAGVTTEQLWKHLAHHVIAS